MKKSSLSNTSPNSKLTKIISVIVGVSGLFLTSLALFFNLSNGLNLTTLSLLSVVFCFCLLIILYPKLPFLKLLFQKPVTTKIFFSIICIIGIILRLLPLLTNMQFSCESLLSDTGVHYYGAQEIVDGNLGPEITNYDKNFPYLPTYTFILAFFQSIFHNISISIVISNLFFDIISIICFFFILKKLKSRPKLGATIWILSPFSIVMCWLPLNIACVNMILFSAILVFITLNQYLLSLKHPTSKKNVCHLMLLSLFCGIMVFIGNALRPIFLVLIIAEIIVLLFLGRKSFNKLLIPILSFIIIICSFGILSTLHNHLLNSWAGENITSHSGGWSFFIGSNYQTSGRWSPDDRDYAFSKEFLDQTKSRSNWHSSLFQEGLSRYVQMGPVGAIRHFTNKTGVIFASQGSSAYDLKNVFGYSEDNTTYKIIKNGIAIYCFCLIAICLLFFVRKIKKHYTFSHEELFISLCFLGLTTSLLLVEVMNRYISILLVPMSLIACLFFFNQIKKASTLHHNKKNGRLEASKLQGKIK